MHSTRPRPFIVMLFAACAACDNESDLNAGIPALSIAPAGIDFSEVVLDIAGERGVTLRNDGYGLLQFDDVSLDGLSSPDFSVVSWPEEGLGHDDEGLLVVRYVPDVEGGDVGAVLLHSNAGFASLEDAADTPPAEVLLEGIGVRPCIDLDPAVLYFGVVPPQESRTLPVRVTAGCTGTLKVTHLGFAGEEAVAYSLALPVDYAEPYGLSQGFSFTVYVTFTPPDAGEYRGEIWIESNDSSDATAVVQIIGNTEDVPTENEAPYCQILDPNNGEFFMDDQTVGLEGYVGDADEPATNLLCGWFADGTRIADGNPDADGAVTGESLLPVGDVDLTLRCYDSEGAVCEDTTVLKVWESDEPVTYTISGGISIFDYFSIDDDVTFSVNGTAVYADSDRTSGTLPPVEIEAMRGDVIGIVAIDQNYCDMYIDALTLHWGTGESQPLNDTMCDSACDESACYSGGDYSGPWPSAFLDAEYPIVIPR